MIGSTGDVDADQCYDGGVNAFVQKPVDFDKFAAAVKELGLFWLVINNPPPPPTV